MGTIFTEILNLSVISSFLILAVFVLRLMLNKAPKGIRYIFWAMVGLRLIFPFSFESRLSLLPNAQTFNSDVKTSTAYIPASNAVTQQTVDSSISIADILPYIWLSGVLIMLLYMLISYIKVRLMVREAVQYKDNIYLCDHVHSPFVLGIIKPKIYLSSSMSKKEINLVILHERTHIKHGDNIWKPLAFLLLSVYWFNPLCFLAYFLFVKDIELFCDESVTKTLSRTARKKYSYTLLSFSQKRVTVSACPLAFAENDVKARVKNVLSYKKPTFLIVVVSVVMCVMTMLMFMSSPVSAKVVSEYKFSKSLSQVVKQVEEIAPTQPPTEKPTEKKTAKKAEKKTQNKTEEPQQENHDNSYDNSYEYSGDTYSDSDNNYEVKPEYEYLYSKDIYNQENPKGVVAYDNLQPYEGEISWDPN